MNIIGIDLGTTNSACGVWQDGEARLIANRSGDLLTPSVVGLDGTQNVIVGKVARNRLITHPETTVAVFKRLMGTSHRVQVGKQQFTATELSSFVIRALKEDAETFLEQPVGQAIISVPAYFNDNQRQATKQAAEIAGLEVNRLINEPTAAALAYSLHNRSDGVFVVLDLGGGTFDVSVIEYFDGVMEVHASAGDNYLGGEDFLNAMISRFLSDNAVERESLSREEQHILNEVMENAKVRLGGPKSPVIDVEIGGKRISACITAEWFKETVTPLLLNVRRPIEQALRDARFSADKIEEVILVGGATRMAPFRTTVAGIFSMFPYGHIDPDLVVAVGATVQAGLHARDEALDDLVLTDVCPYSLGTAIVDPEGSGRTGHFLPLIERNSVVPTSHVATLWTVEDNQTRIEISVYQGENRLVEKNVFLGSFEVRVPKNKENEESVDLRFSYDMNGILEIDVTINSTGEKINHVIEQSPGALNKKEMEKSRQRLAALKFHPREKEENMELLSRGERIYRILLGPEREAIARVLMQFERTLDGQKELEIKKAREQLSEVLGQFEKDNWI